MEARINLEAAGSEIEIEEVAADKGYHAAATLELAADLDLRTYIPEPQRKDDRVWTDKPAEVRRAVVNNRRRMAARRASSCSGCGASVWSGASPTCATRAACGGPGCAGLKT